jgi:hypothetical protein
VNKDGSATGVAGCNSANNPNYIVTIPASDIFYDPPIATIGYVPLVPPPQALMNAAVAIDLFYVQQAVLINQAK